MNTVFARTNVAGVVINPHGEILVAQRGYTKKFKPGVWHLPGGKVEDTEDIAEALTRELEEEFQMPRSIIESISQTGSQFEYEVDSDKHRTLICVVRLNASFTPVLNYESEQAVFVKPRVVMSLIDQDDVLYEQHIQLFATLNLTS
jgi:8-oxo-dGTP diphosphatase